MDCVILLFLLLVLNCFEKWLSAVFGVGGGGGVALWILLPFSRFCEIFSKIGVNFCSFVCCIIHCCCCSCAASCGSFSSWVVFFFVIHFKRVLLC